MKNTKYTKSVERIAVGNWEVVYEGEGWKSVGQGETCDEATDAAFAALATSGAPEETVEAIALARGRRLDRRAYDEMCKEERDAHDNK